MNKSDQINELATALSKAQGQMDAAHKDSKNPFFKSSYADLSSCWDACRKPLNENGLAVIQLPEVADNGIALRTILTHASGQWIESVYHMPVSKGDAQAVGSALTYARRYALCSIIGISPVDDDGNAAAKSPPAKKITLSTDQALHLKDLAKEIGVTNIDFIKVIMVERVEDLAASKYQKAIDWLESQRKQDDVPQ